MRPFRLVAFYWVTMLLVFSLVDTASATLYYVDQSVSSSGDGLSWSTAKKSISEAMTLAGVDDVILVAEGLYYERVVINDGVTLEGGYPTGGGTRDFRTHLTIIDAGAPIPSNPAVTMGMNTVIDGFTIKNGTGYSTMIFSTFGAGIYCASGGNIIITNNVIVDNVINSVEGAYGAGIYAFNCNIEISNNVIARNVTNGMGGGSAICAWNSTAKVFNNFIHANDSSNPGNGALYFNNSSGSIYNNTITGNTGAGGGGINLAGSSPEIFNNIIYLNSGYGIGESDADSDPLCSFNDFADNSAGLYLDEGTTIYNSITLLDTTVPECSENLDCTPSFISPDDYRLAYSSCCVDAGRTLGAPLTDIDGEPRPLGKGVEIGCDEVSPLLIPAFSLQTGIIAVFMVTLILVLTILFGASGFCVGKTKKSYMEKAVHWSEA